MNSFIVNSYLAKNKSTKLTKYMYSLCRLAYDTVSVLYLDDDELLILSDVTRDYGSLNQLYRTIFSDIEINLNIAYSATANICKSYLSFIDITTIACTSKEINSMITNRKMHFPSDPFEIFISQYYNFDEWDTIRIFIEENKNTEIALIHSSSCIQTLINYLRSIFIINTTRKKQFLKLNSKLFEINRGLEDISNNIKILSIR